MLDNKWFDNSDKKFMFMYYENDNTLHQFKVKVSKNQVTYQAQLNGLTKEDKKFDVDQDKVPNMAYRFYLIMMILAKEFTSLHLGRVQLIIDKGFENEKQELIDLEKNRSLDIIAQEMVNSKQQEKANKIKFAQTLKE